MTTTRAVDSAALLRKISRRILPFAIVCYLFNYIDRINISLAVMPMTADPDLPGFSEKVYALGAGLFFIGYCLFEVPSNLLQQRFGARRWIARIMISWGIVSTCFLFVSGPWSFYILRIILGFAEAGFFPGMVLYLSLWVPDRHRARFAALLLTSTAIAGVIGNPLGGAILFFAPDFHPFLKPWQYLFLFEGIPTILLGLFTLFVISDTPKDARWLSDDERAHLQTLLDEDHHDHPAPHLSEFKHAFSSPHVWVLTLLYTFHTFGFYAINFWTPLLIKNTLTSSGIITKATPQPVADLKVSLLAAIPFGIAAIGMVLIGRSSDKRRERRFHLAFAYSLATVGLGIAALAPSVAPPRFATFITISGLAIGAVGAFGSFGPFWSLPNSLLAGTAAATAIAVINSLGNLGGGLGGQVLIKALSLKYGLLLAAALAFLAVLLTLFMPLKLRRHASSPAPH